MQTGSQQRPQACPLSTKKIGTGDVQTVNTNETKKALTTVPPNTNKKFQMCYTLKNKYYCQT